MTNFSDEINQMIFEVVGTTQYTSANSDHTNIVKNPGQSISPDLESIIMSIVEGIVVDRLSQTGIPALDNATANVAGATGKDEFSGMLPQNKEQLLKFAQNPKAVVGGIIRAIPFLGGIVAVADFSKAVIDEIERIDAFFKKFIPDITNLHNQLRAREESAFINVGNQQLILSVRAGQTSPRLAYNTYNEFNKNRLKFESDTAIRDNSGV